MRKRDDKFRPFDMDDDGRRREWEDVRQRYRDLATARQKAEVRDNDDDDERIGDLGERDADDVKRDRPRSFDLGQFRRRDRDNGRTEALRPNIDRDEFEGRDQRDRKDEVGARSDRRDTGRDNSSDNDDDTQLFPTPRRDGFDRDLPPTQTKPALEGRDNSADGNPEATRNPLPNRDASDAGDVRDDIRERINNRDGSPSGGDLRERLRGNDGESPRGDLRERIQNRQDALPDRTPRGTPGTNPSDRVQGDANVPTIRPPAVDRRPSGNNSGQNLARPQANGQGPAADRRPTGDNSGQNLSRPRTGRSGPAVDRLPTGGNSGQNLSRPQIGTRGPAIDRRPTGDNSRQNLSRPTPNRSVNPSPQGQRSVSPQSNRSISPQGNSSPSRSRSFQGRSSNRGPSANIGQGRSSSSRGSAQRGGGQGGGQARGKGQNK